VVVQKSPVGIEIDTIHDQIRQCPDIAAETMYQRVGSCYLELSFGTTGVDTWCYLVLPGVLPRVTWALPGVTGCYLGFHFEVFSFGGPKISAFLKLKPLGKNQFPPRDVTWAHAYSRYLFTGLAYRRTLWPRPHFF